MVPPSPASSSPLLSYLPLSLLPLMVLLHPPSFSLSFSFLSSSPFRSSIMLPYVSLLKQPLPDPFFIFVVFIPFVFIMLPYNTFCNFCFLLFTTFCWIITSTSKSQGNIIYLSVSLSLSCSVIFSFVCIPLINHCQNYFHS